MQQNRRPMSRILKRGSHSSRLAPGRSRSQPTITLAPRPRDQRMASSTELSVCRTSQPRFLSRLMLGVNVATSARSPDVTCSQSRPRLRAQHPSLPGHPLSELPALQCRPALERSSAHPSRLRRRCFRNAPARPSTPLHRLLALSRRHIDHAHRPGTAVLAMKDLTFFQKASRVQRYTPILAGVPSAPAKSSPCAYTSPHPRPPGLPSPVSTTSTTSRAYICLPADLPSRAQTRATAECASPPYPRKDWRHLPQGSWPRPRHRSRIKTRWPHQALSHKGRIRRRPLPYSPLLLRRVSPARSPSHHQRFRLGLQPRAVCFSSASTPSPPHLLRCSVDE